MLYKDLNHTNTNEVSNALKHYISENNQIVSDLMLHGFTRLDGIINPIETSNLNNTIAVYGEQLKNINVNPHIYTYFNADNVLKYLESIEKLPNGKAIFEKIAQMLATLHMEYFIKSLSPEQLQLISHSIIFHLYNEQPTIDAKVDLLMLAYGKKTMYTALIKHIQKRDLEM